MQQESKIGFLWQYVIACIHPSQYKELIKKKKGAFIGYVAVLVMFLVLIENVIPFAAWTTSVGGFENLLLNRIPKFTLENGHFQSESPIDFTIGGVIRIKADSSVEEFKESDFKSDYVQELLVSKKNILIKMPGGNQQIILSQFKNWKLNNKGLVEMLPAFYMFLAFYLVVLLITKAVQYLFVALVFALICRGSVRTTEGKVVSMAESFYIAVYARTLAAIISSVNVALGYIVDSFILMIVTVFITMGFIMRGEISVLDPQPSKEQKKEELVMSKVIMVTGGSRSGKSVIAEQKAKEYGKRSVLYLATAIPIDDDMKERIRIHQERRDPEWGTYEGYRDLGEVVKSTEKNTILLDCVTVMITNILFEEEDRDFDKISASEVEKLENEVIKELSNLVKAIRDEDKTLVIVSNEVGMSLVPSYRLGRIFSDISGKANQVLASLSDEVYVAISGLPLRLKQVCL